MSAPHVVIAVSESERLRILGHLQELLDSPAFAGSRRRQAFLKYVVEETLAGRGAAIKETTIAVDVFGRTSDFDAQSASIVRVTGGEVRKRLAQAYSSGLKSEIRIELPLGGYQPSFQFVTEEPATHEVAAPAVLDSPQSTWRWRRPLWLAAGVIALVALIPAASRIRGLVAAEDPLDQLWRPFLHKDGPVLISLQSPTVLYIPNREKWLPLQPGVMIPSSEIQTLESVYVGTGAALGGALFAEQLAARGQRFTIKFGTDVSFADMKTSPAILIGTSRWTQELTKPLRFYMTAEAGSMIVHDAQQPDRKWTLRYQSSSQVTEGYSIITRLLPAESGFPLILIAGMDPRNTQAAVEFLTQAGSFESFARTAPADWSKKSFQVVLHNNIHGNSPGSLNVVASHVW